ncbi:MAG: multicopper oxidase family protein [Gammaproteobacteria bacterium]|nr:multicopper oxidase family protein [Gammaproteobacteria bacterium]NIR85625.1 multicopper oxidase family protein [Gammaproteobacteria bacterium]NIR90113.1 multicopper oxidase family protein [Gammaproteobacteria bacterium]NIU06759.1 multicopper oxidase family protein [Gammaproteobacteria bacterium]NIV53692.1 multicopper oxidase domain-containing protein [Gammaproteobacteria bacterium]
MTRRAALQALAGLAASPVVAPRRTFGAGMELLAPPPAPSRRPEPGLLEVALDARPAEVAVAERRASLWTYGGTFPGPLVRAQEGDTVRLRFRNRLPEATNLHYHGLHIPPTGRADNIWLRIEPGQTFDYEFTIPEGEGGTYWYHPHLHGTISRQLWRGMAGPLVVESPVDAIPELAAADDRVVVLKDLALVDGWPAPHEKRDWHMGKEGDLVLVNGALSPRLTARSGTVRLRLINASNARYFRLGSDDGRPLHLITTDGHFLKEPVALDEILLSPAQRADLLVPLAGERPLALMHLPYDRRVTRLPLRPTPLLTLIPKPGAKPGPLPGRLLEPPPLRIADASVRRRVSMAMFHIDGKPFNPARLDTLAHLGDLEHWEIVNYGTMDHNFHLHTWYFQVAAHNGVPAPYPRWQDTVNLKPGDRVELLVPMRSYPGRTVYHCHISEHGDKGMMAVIDVRG